MIRTKMTKFGFVRTALAVGVAIPILAGTGAFAQAAHARRPRPDVSRATPEQSVRLPPPRR